MLHYHVMSEISEYVQTASTLEISTDDMGIEDINIVLGSETLRDLEPKW